MSRKGDMEAEDPCWSKWHASSIITGSYGSVTMHLSKAIKKTIGSLNISFLSAGLFAVEPEIVNAILRDRTFRLSKHPSDVARNSWDRLIRNHINDNNNGSSWRD